MQQDPLAGTAIYDEKPIKSSGAYEVPADDFLVEDYDEKE